MGNVGRNITGSHSVWWSGRGQLAQRISGTAHDRSHHRRCGLSYRESTCFDASGDSTSTAVDLEQVRLLSDGSLMFLTFTTTATVPTTGTVLYSVMAWSEDGNTVYQMGAKFENGREVSDFVFDIADATQENITNGAVAADKEVSMRYPLAELEG